MRRSKQASSVTAFHDTSDNVAKQAEPEISSQIFDYSASKNMVTDRVVTENLVSGGNLIGQEAGKKSLNLAKS